MANIETFSTPSVSEEKLQRLRAECCECEHLCWYHAAVQYMPSYMGFCNVSVTSEIVNGEPLCQQRCTTYTGLKYLFGVSGLGDQYWNYSKVYIPKEDTGVWRAVTHICKNVLSFVAQGQNLVFHSSLSGNGKTLASILITKYLIQESVADGRYNANLCRYVYIPKLISQYEYYDKLDKFDSRRIAFFEELDRLHQYRFVVWDGIGYDSKTKLEDIIIRSVINSRINDALSNLFICYGTLDALKLSLKQPDINRIIDASLVLEFFSTSFRNNGNFGYVQ